VFKARVIIIQKQVCHETSAVGGVGDGETGAGTNLVHDGSCSG
jgi:hypothetical protein